jgi:hypothetical protein
MGIRYKALFYQSLSPEKSPVKTERSFYETGESEVSSQQSNNSIIQ